MDKLSTNLKITIVGTFLLAFLLFGVSIEDPLELKGNPELLNYIIKN